MHDPCFDLSSGSLMLYLFVLFPPLCFARADSARDCRTDADADANTDSAPSCVAAFANMLSYNRSLRALDLERNQLGTRGVRLIAQVRCSVCVGEGAFVRKR
jgi:hypothetical protein